MAKRRNKNAFEKFGRNVKRTAQDPNTWIGAGVGAAVMAPLAALSTKLYFLSMADEYADEMYADFKARMESEKA